MAADQDHEQEQRRRLLAVASRFPLPNGARFSYGTAGFRADGATMASAVCRAALLAALRSVKLAGAAVGIVITASHNPVRDNGVKIADPDGGMMDQCWEPFADTLANAPDPDALLQLVLQFAKDEGIPLGRGGHHTAQVLLGRDTRPTGEYLLDAALQGINAIVGARAIDMGILTTPQLHWMVRSKNKGIKASESDYFTQLIDSFRRLLELVPKDKGGDDLSKKLIVDGANGIGGVKLEQIKAELSGLNIIVRNSGKEGEGILNHMCGADFVQKERVTPHGFSPDDIGVRCASLDGDADRLVYFHVSSASNNSVALVDGDKILSLFALFIREQLDIISDNGGQANKPLPSRLGIVQTAYANGASTKFLKSLGLEVVFTPTGVKYLHKKALEYDIGIYFEANGHGTVLFSEDFIAQLESLSNELCSRADTAQYQAAMRLMAASQLINQAVGDALSGFLLVEAILQYKGWSFQNWCELYSDLPSRQLKVKVIDRTAIITTDAETKVSQPSGLQELIDMEIANYAHGRCFVRPSGTEDVVRVYAEASTQEAADSLAKSVACHVESLLG
ncbi:phosphoacetylglucosamine mutase isoform X2 [Phragmites australis]|uniref:phosphoacetylglucosamine mutase isoform X2 n=1 Tax=Phragmites australis TaxID=29695 RepID=UPI002D7653E1|nr:phosphoacetylglucosamine mutase isoform X2 [Phragmites australis]